MFWRFLIDSGDSERSYSMHIVMTFRRSTVLPSSKPKMHSSRWRNLPVCGTRRNRTHERGELRRKALRLPDRTARPALRSQETIKEEDKIRVVVVDDDQDMRQLMKAIVERTGACTCVGTFADADKALAGIPAIVPDVVLMDVEMPGLNGIECTKRLKSITPEIRVIMVTGQHAVNVMNDSLRAGADAYLLKPVTTDQCLATIKFALGDKKAADLLLSEREHQVMKCLVQGLLYKEIGDKLGLSYSAVHKHQHKIFLKLGVNNRSEAIEKWHKLRGA